MIRAIQSVRNKMPEEYSVMVGVDEVAKRQYVWKL